MVYDWKREANARNPPRPRTGARPEQLNPEAEPAGLLAADFLACIVLIFGG